LEVAVRECRPFLVLAFDEQKAQLLGLRPALAHWVLLGLLTAVIVGSFQTVGTLLVFGMRVGSPAAAVLIVQRLPLMMLTAAVTGALSVAVSLILGFHIDTAGSATMALVPIVLFFVVLTVRTVATQGRKAVGELPGEGAG
jgi:manganese/iron transport system permease protein